RARRRCRWAGRTEAAAPAGVNGTAGGPRLGRAGRTVRETGARGAPRAEPREREFTEQADLNLVEPALGGLEPLRVERLDGVRGARDDRLGVLVRLEVREHPVGEVAPVAAPGPPDADAQAQEVRRAEMPRDRAQAVVPGEAAAPPRLEAARLEVALVVDDEDRAGLELEEVGGRPDRPARLVHVRLRLEQPDAVAVDAHLGEPARELAAEAGAVAPRELVHDHVADVVPVPGVLAPRVAEADDEQVERRGAFAPAPGQPHQPSASVEPPSPAAPSAPSAGASAAASAASSPSTASTSGSSTRVGVVTVATTVSG